MAVPDPHRAWARARLGAGTRDAMSPGMRHTDRTVLCLFTTMLAACGGGGEELAGPDSGPTDPTEEADAAAEIEAMAPPERCGDGLIQDGEECDGGERC